MRNSFKDLGVVYTPESSFMIPFLCQKTIFPFILDKINEYFNTHFVYQGNLDFLTQLSNEHLNYMFHILRELKILDPSVGSGHFLLEALNTLEKLYKYLVKNSICRWTGYQIRKAIIQNQLFGVDIAEKAVEQCRNNLIKTLDINNHGNNSSIELKHNIKLGNSLIGNLFQQSNKLLNNLEFNWRKEFPVIINQGGWDIVVGNPPWNILKPLEKEFFSFYDPRLTKYSVDKREAKQIIQNLLQDKDIKNKWIKYKSSIEEEARYFRSNEYKYQRGQMTVAGVKKTISGDLNLYKLFLERIYYLTKGYCGVIIPSGFHTDAGTKSLRRLIFENSNVRELYCFENRKGIFPSIHKSFKFDLLIFKKDGRTSTFQTAFMLRNLNTLDHMQDKSLSINWDIIKKFSPSSWSIIEFKTKKDIELASKMYQHPPLGSLQNESWIFRLKRELDISLDSKLFNTDKKGLTVMEGKMIEQYTHKYKKPRYWIEKNNIFSKFGEGYQDFKEHRIGFRAIAASTNRRTMIATILPPNCICGNSIIVSRLFDENGRRLLSKSDLFFLVGILNSFVFDYLLRLKVSQNLNMFFIYDIPVPRVSKESEIYQEIVRNVTRVLNQFNNSNQVDLSYLQGLSCIKEIVRVNNLVARLYDIDHDSMEYILDQFHIKDPKKEKALNLQKLAILETF